MLIYMITLIGPAKYHANVRSLNIAGGIQITDFVTSITDWVMNMITGS